MIIPSSDNAAADAAVQAIRNGDTNQLQESLSANPDLARARPDGARSLLHVATDWPGEFPNVARAIAILVAAGADVNARFNGEHRETPLHWAASTGDLSAIDALLDAGADIDASGSVLGGGPPLSDAIGFAQWEAARRLVERGAPLGLWDAAALGMTDRIHTLLDASEPLAAGELDLALWAACHGGQRAAAEVLLERGSNLNVVPPWEPATPLDAALRNGFDAMAAWLRARGARSASEAAGMPHSPR